MKYMSGMQGIAAFLCKTARGASSSHTRTARCRTEEESDFASFYYKIQVKVLADVSLLPVLHQSGNEASAMSYIL